MKPEDIAGQVYKPLHNKYMDEMFKLIRSRFGGYNIPKHSTAREAVSYTHLSLDISLWY